MAMFTVATAFHFVLTVASTPALHASHSKHSTCMSLLHARQSPSPAAAADSPDPGAAQKVAFTYRNPHRVGGLQQPDCTLHENTYEALTHSRSFQVCKNH